MVLVAMVGGFLQRLLAERPNEVSELFCRKCALKRDRSQESWNKNGARINTGARTSTFLSMSCIADLIRAIVLALVASRKF